MIIDCISDTHGFLPKTDGGDLLIIAGDITANDSIYEYDEFFRWLSMQNYRKKIYISGNHDTLLESGEYKALDCEATYLCDASTEFEGVKIWGSPWSLWFENINPRCAAFTALDRDLRKTYSKIPIDTNVIISHTPPFNVLDEIEKNDHIYRAGSVALNNEIFGNKKRFDYLRFVVCGHIHENGGKEVDVSSSNLKIVNCSYVNEKYEPTNKVMRVIL